MTQAILLPGGVMPAELAYGALLAAFGDGVHAVAKELEIYADAAPPDGYTLQHETDRILRTAEAVAIRRHLMLADQAQHPELPEVLFDDLPAEHRVPVCGQHDRRMLVHVANAPRRGA